MGKKNNRIITLVYGYYLGQLIQSSVTPRSKWLEYTTTQQFENEYYYYQGATRIYKLFKENITQIYQTFHLTFNDMYRMKNSNYEELIHYFQSIAEVASSITLS